MIYQLGYFNNNNNNVSNIFLLFLQIVYGTVIVDRISFNHSTSKRESEWGKSTNVSKWERKCVCKLSREKKWRKENWPKPVAQRISMQKWSVCPEPSILYNKKTLKNIQHFIDIRKSIQLTLGLLWLEWWNTYWNMLMMITRDWCSLIH